MSRRTDLTLGRLSAGTDGGGRSATATATASVMAASSRSGSRLDRDNNSSCDSNSSNGTDSINDSGSQRMSKLRPLARLDRLLRRWLPGYSYLRGITAKGSSSGVGSGGGGGGTVRRSAEQASMPSRLNSAMEEQQQQQPLDIDPPLSVRKRRDGEVLLDAGIAKSEFCLKLEKLLRAKLIVKD
ncbi:hypothetical protein AWZ03_011524 [Drosophila navojoa]|uniref:Uncharacterized protein n=1 Tax=Drosophila navojoa TaxID=7232 RepID=A0A484B1S6_DRONA|nr:uncharacterized protein LOC108655846 [Drosophila navojoa]TDG42040.1 hypothetical protein AWZ03_011524 [Drosophila navojoa]